jgi:peroxiredoxin
VAAALVIEPHGAAFRATSRGEKQPFSYALRASNACTAISSPRRAKTRGWVMTIRDTLAESLRQLRDGSRWTPIYDAFVEKARALRIGDEAPKVGDAFPDFALPDHRGRFVSLASLTAAGPLVLSFNRGRWCPFCYHELRAWADAIPALRAHGARFASVTPEIGGQAGSIAAVIGPHATTLCDIDNGVALQSGLMFHVGGEIMGLFRESGLDLAAVYGSASGFLPVPATFLIDQDRVVRYAFTDADFRVRAEPSDVLGVLAEM